MRMFSHQDRCDGFIGNDHLIILKLVGFKKSLCFQCADKSDCLAQFPLWNKVRKRTMTLLLDFFPTRFPHVSCSRIVRVVHYFVKLVTIPAVESEIDLSAKFFGSIDGLDVLQDDRLKINHPLSVPLPSS